MKEKTKLREPGAEQHLNTYGVPYLFKGFQFDATDPSGKVLKMRISYINGDAAMASDGVTEMSMRQRDGLWYSDKFRTFRK